MAHRLKNEPNGKNFDGLELDILNKFRGDKLPTNKEVLERYFSIRDQSCKTTPAPVIAEP